MGLPSLLTAILALSLLATTPPLPEDSTKEEKEILLTLIPHKTEIASLKGRSVPEFYDPQNLFDYINGQAETYLDYGFRLLITREYTAADGLAVTLEIYKMESPLHAFGIYAAERTPEDRPVSIGAAGFLGSNILGFWKGPYYCRILFYQTSQELEKILQKTGSLIADKIKGSYGPPELFSLFPEKFRVKWSERFIPKHFLGQSYLKNGYRVDYERLGTSYQVFLSQAGSQREAQDFYLRYQEFLRAERQRLSPSSKGDYETVLVQGEMNMILFRYGNFWGGVQGENHIHDAEGIIRALVERLRTKQH